MGLRIKVSLIKCGTCGKRYSNPRTHRCVTRIGRRVRPTSLRPRITVECPKCHKPGGLTHVCKTRTDFRRKLAASKKQAAADKRAQAASLAKVKRSRQSGPAKPRHDYRSCRDTDCARVACVAYRDGLADCPLAHR